MPFWIALLVAAGAGGLHAWSFSDTALWWLQLLAVALLAWRVRACRRAGRAALLGWVFGTAWLVGGTWWLFISMHRYGGLPAWLAGAAVLLLGAFLSLYLGLAMAAYVRLAARTRLWKALLFAAVWLLAELARGVIFTGFPWVASGYAHVDGPLAPLAPWVGVYGIGFVAAWLGASAARLAGRGGRRAHGWAPLLTALGLCVVASLVSDSFTTPTRSLAVTLLQGNVPQDEKFSATLLPQVLQWYADELEAAGGDLVITPETAIPLLPGQLPAGYWDGLAARFRQGGTAALIGQPLGDFTEGYTNSAVGLAPGGAGYRYDKHHLVPFGEFIPTGFRWFVDMMHMPLGDFDRGPLNAPSFEVHGERVAPNICYEDLFGEELAARFADPARAPTLFANISNIGWFGDTVAVYQHLQISRMRTLEFQLPMVRATNTGATALIDHNGRVTQQLPPFTRGVLSAPVQGRSGLTPFARWASVAGLWPLLALAVAVLLAAAGLRRRSR
ncbi:apolipoprotein N-acyltransferase [Aquabacterium sp. A7-Y]|uniref:apolipoprotein N-acyltransferase n=1 Tax=Aquabacterium sp. A7-Y TaxID=1349605 RepID=UPI00223E0C54|nr:apolipoprotein N-acyltransferase [Aquabacterium sp. A7-Y]MCW7537261.1 apolipoprotein N-acyltransferase [Aquabacterium sp. A7-Y]